jgi:BlaI family penicillinase repressor
MNSENGLSRRERQIMDVIYARQEATASHVMEGMEDAPTRAAVRTFLRILEEKGHLTHRKEGREFVYVPTRPRERAGVSALKRVLSTFFGGSLGDAVSAHLSEPGAKLDPAEVARLRKLLHDARKKGA